MENKIDKVNRKISDMKKMKQRYCPEDRDGKEDFSARISHALPVRISHCLSAVYRPTLVPFYFFTLLLLKPSQHLLYLLLFQDEKNVLAVRRIVDI